MQFSKITSTSRRHSNLGLIIKISLIIIVIAAAVTMLGKIDFPAPNKQIEKIIPNEKFKIVK